MLLQFAAIIFSLLLVYLSILAADDVDAHDQSPTLVASRNPFRENAPPANMAKLLMMRQKIQTTNRRRRSPSNSRPPLRPLNQNLPRKPSPWTRISKAFRNKQYY
ncbi:hypothetical protein MIND_00718500 [Mycena indigotica]|uniref:Uncharacterized protein n=1 Tax=Mycena indigotica TaxID=2126181 RepID=A0A8H6SMF1_9AGAR|nr:uncharacterized protein MIND_00718500 [Mycena indigotica]KAF7301530.1 hypothetical protein MIND_00718500 [Mycena indigotica]